MINKITEADFIKAGGDPMRVPAIKEAMRKIPGQLQEESQQSFEDGQRNSDAAEMMPEGVPLLPVVAGVQVVRDITAGVFNILNKMKSPLVTGEELEDDNEYLQEMAFLLFLMSYEDVGQIVRWFRKGPEVLREEFDIWAFEFVNLQSLMAEHEELSDLLGNIMEASEELPGDDDGKSSKKKSVG